MPSRSWNTSTWPSVAGPAPMPITGISRPGISSSVTAARDRLEDEREAARILERVCLEGDARGGAGRPPLRLPAPEGSGRLGGEADMAHHGDARATIARARRAEVSPPPSSLTASQPASLTMRMAVVIACSSETS